MLNVSKCSVLDLKLELEAFGEYGDSEEETWGLFKEIETQLWLADHQSRSELDDTVADQGHSSTEEKTTVAASAQDGSTGNTTDANESWSWTNVKRGVANENFGLTFQDIQSWDLFTLQQEMKTRDQLY